MPEWLLPTLTFVAGAAGTWLLLRIRFERFEAMDTRREADWAKWRADVDEKLHEMNGALLERVNRMERDIGDHDTGMRRDIRECSKDLFKLDARMEALERAEDEQ